ncbi:hypothetical protein [uncultured Slackia sp.]|uniref:hypothetical protein n=1 Tax=uncultured Slackia sp. TaxID=665903 RepID=UPI002676A188|nr:hypothetical protein [uncultured Slackia sp.]
MEILDALLFAAELAQAHKAVARHTAATIATMRPRAMRGLTDSFLKCFMVSPSHFNIQQRKSDGNEAPDKALHQKLMKCLLCAEKHWARVADAPKPAEPYDFQRTWRRARRPRVRRKSLGCVSGDRRLKEGERDEGRRI